MPLKAWPTMCIHKSNHASWELDPEAQRALGPTIAKWLAAGNLELVLVGNPMPLYIEPCGAVKKSSDPWFRLITDGRVGNGIYAPWSVVYHTLRDVALVLVRCDFMFCKDIANAHHSGAFAGCGLGIIEEDATLLTVKDGGAFASNASLVARRVPVQVLVTSVLVELCCFGACFALLAANSGRPLLMGLSTRTSSAWSDTLLHSRSQYLCRHGWMTCSQVCAEWCTTFATGWLVAVSSAPQRRKRQRCELTSVSATPADNCMCGFPTGKDLPQHRLVNSLESSSTPCVVSSQWPLRS